MYFILIWFILWLMFESCSYAASADFDVVFWMHTAPIRFVIWPALYVLLLRALWVAYWECGEVR